ncbi:MAG: nucleotidyl transferase AbiEii/AbiGii toxin family protein [Deltaproteobacteria bacterium]|nr:nucleotidyl transferase AbiEii/AbiGii toxin family protein [Deltaproteobacteria bacterium]
MQKLPPESFVEDLLNVCSTLNQLQVPYMLIGGLAVALWATPRATVDLDFVISLREEDFSKFKSALEATKLDFISPHLFKLKKITIVRFCLCKKAHELIMVDLILAENEFLKNAIQRRQSFPLLKENVYVVTPEDLILLKLLSLRPQDVVDIQNVILHQKKLDKGYLMMWAKKLKLVSHLKKFLSSS